MAKKKEKTISPTDAQWTFASVYVRTQSVLEAFKSAYPMHGNKPMHRIRSLAKRQLVQQGTQAAIKELTHDIRTAEKLTVEGHMAELRKIRDAAFEDGKYSVARQAEVDRGKCAGFYIERSLNMNVITSPQELKLQFEALLEQYPQVSQFLPQLGGGTSPDQAQNRLEIVEQTGEVVDA